MRVRIKSKESAGLVGYAKQRLAALRSVLPPGVQFVKRLLVGDTVVTLDVNPVEDIITLEGVGGQFTLVLSGPSGTFLYDYEHNKLVNVSADDGILFQLNTQQIAQRAGTEEVKHQILSIPGKHASITAIPPFDFACHVSAAGRGVLASGASVFTQTLTGEFVETAAFDTTQTASGLFQTGESAFILFSGREVGWNYVSSPNAWGVNVKDVQYTEDVDSVVSPYSWQWVPRIYRVWSGSAIDPSGLHYLAIQKEPRQYGDINPEGPYTEVSVEFCGILDSRSSTKTDGGVAERLKNTISVDAQGLVTETPRIELFFTEGMYEPELASFYKNDELYTVGYGTALTPPQHLFSVDYENPLGHELPVDDNPVPQLPATAVIAAKWWVGEDGTHGVVAYADDDLKTFYVHRFGAADVVEPNTAEGETWVRQYGKLLYFGTGFRDCSYSVDGALCSVLYVTEETTEGGGTEETAHVAVIDVVAGAVLADNVLGGYSFKYGQIILQPADSVAEDTRTPIDRDDVPLIAAPAERDKAKEYSLYGFGHFKDRHRGGHLGGWKLSIENGVAAAKHWADVCWASVYTKHDSYRNPLGAAPAEEYAQLLFRESEVHTNPEGLSTTTWHYFTGSIAATTFLTSAGGNVIPPEGAEPLNSYEFARFGIYFHWEGECIYVSGNTAVPYDITNTHLIYDGHCRVLDPPHCGDMDLKLTDACGEEYVLERGLTPFLIGGDSYYEVGSVFQAGGGLGNPVYSASCGEIAEDSGVVTSIEGCCGAVLVTASDACGHSASVDSFANVGQWVQVQFGETPPETRIRQLVVYGNTMIERSYVGAGVEYTNEYSDGLGNCVPVAAPPASTCSGQVATCRTICSWTASTPGVETLDGSISLVTSTTGASPWCAGGIIGGKEIIFGAICWAIDNKYTNVWNWECP